VISAHAKGAGTPAGTKLRPADGQVNTQLQELAKKIAKHG
jgi:hypothetical protein